MSLFTDSGLITLDDLLQFESSLIDVCTTHGIDATTKIKIATNGIGDKLTLWLLRSTHSNPQCLFPRKIGLNTIVVSPALYRWLCFDSLARVFAEAYNVQLNTRFQGKWTEYQKEAQDAATLVYASGLEIVWNPLAKPALPAVTVGIGTINLASLFVQTTWVNRDGRESAPSEINAAVLNGFSSLLVRANAIPGAPPSTATGWNIYASATQQNLTRQNTAPIPIQTSWQMPDSGLIVGTAMQTGQTPDVLIPLAGRIQRG